MKKFILLSFVVLLSFSFKAQWLWDYGVSVGATNYLGDIGGKEKTRRDFVADLKISQTRWNGGAFVRYKLGPKLSTKLALDYVRIQGDDKLSSNLGRHFRNFNFKNDIVDLGLTGEFFFYENNDLGNTYRYKNGFRAYVFGGVGGFYTNPKTLYKGEWVKLRDYQTEGYAYKKIVLNIPMGVGFYFTFDKKHRLGFEANYRKTFTDYIDDISGNYPTTIPGDAYTQGLIIRTNELPASEINDNKGAYLSHTWGSKRGDKTHKDAYMTLSLSYSYVIRGKSSFYRSRQKGGFFSRGKKRTMRKIRAKF
jgi:hypothetical protein